MTELHREEELLSAVSGLGEEDEPDEQARARAAQLDPGELDLRGTRDRDPDAPRPWRSS